MKIWFVIWTMSLSAWAQETTETDSIDVAELQDEEMRALDEAPDGPPLSGQEALALATDVGEMLRCPQCQGLSVSASKADAAQAMFGRILELVEQGYSEEQILTYFEGRYGTAILLEPPAEGMNWLIWLGPVAVFLLGSGWVVLRARGSTQRSSSENDGVDEPLPRVSDATLDEEEAGLLGLDAQRTETIDPYLKTILDEVAERSKSG